MQKLFVACLLLLCAGCKPYHPRETGENPVGPSSSYTSANCAGDLYNCSAFATPAAAQALFDYCFPTYGDIHNLDQDNDKIACEA